MRMRAPFRAKAPEGRTQRDGILRRYLACFGIGYIEYDPEEGNLWTVDCVRNGCSHVCEKALPKNNRQKVCSCSD